MKLLTASLSLLITPSIAFGTDICRKVPHDPEVPAGLEGTYEVVGQDPVAGTAYSGTLAISAGKSGYGVARVINGKVTTGTAWIEECGQDNIQSLSISYSASPPILAICMLARDGDNNHRVTCRTRTGAMSWRGLESWFQTP